MSELGKAMIELIKQYEKATKQEFIRNPLAYALYQTWKIYDREEQE